MLLPDHWPIDSHSRVCTNQSTNRGEANAWVDFLGHSKGLLLTSHFPKQYSSMHQAAVVVLLEYPVFWSHEFPTLFLSQRVWNVAVNSVDVFLV